MYKYACITLSDIAVEIVEDSPFATSDNLFNEEKYSLKENGLKYVLKLIFWDVVPHIVPYRLYKRK